MSNRALEPFGTSVFTGFSRLAREAGAGNLGQGFPDFDGPEWIANCIYSGPQGHCGLNEPTFGRCRTIQKETHEKV